MWFVMNGERGFMCYSDAIDAMNKLVLKRDNGDALEAVSFAFANLTVNNEDNRR
jgi:hypothetical protein